MKKINLDLATTDEIEVTEDSEINALFKGESKKELKSIIKIVHIKPGLKSRINIKAILMDEAKFDLDAVLIIEKGAKLTDSYLKIECLVIGEKAYARAVPSLEIKENDVKVGHGATIGYIEDEIMDYLKSKGLDQKTSEDLIIKSFIKN